MIVSVPLLLLYFLFVPFLSLSLVLLVLLSLYPFFSLYLLEGHFYYFYTFVFFDMEVEDENGMLIEYLRCYYLFIHIYLIHLPIWDSCSGLFYWVFALLTMLVWSATLPLTSWYLPVLAMCLPPLPPDSNSCFTPPFYLIPTFPTRYMLARIDATALRSLMKFVDRLNGWWMFGMICVYMTRFDSHLLAPAFVNRQNNNNWELK